MGVAAHAIASRLVAPVALLAALSVATTARADSFWRDIADPHGDEVRAVLDRAQRLLSDAATSLYGDQDPTGEVRRHRLDDAYGLARYARRRSPRHPEVLMTLGRAADESGRTAAAIEALTAYLALQPEGSADAHLRLGALLLRQGKTDDAIGHLRQAAAGRHPGVAGLAAVHLAAALESQDRSADAIDALASALGPVSASYWNSDAAVVAFALAVAFDRDEQLSSAWTVLDRLQTGLGGSFAGQIQTAITAVRLAPAVDLHYWQALFYECLGDLDEARTEWLHYAAGGDAARYRPRALAHVAAIDQLLARAPLAHAPRRTP